MITIIMLTYPTQVHKDHNRQVGVPTVWDEVKSVDLDNGRLEHLFESRAKDINAKVSKPCVCPLGIVLKSYLQ